MPKSEGSKPESLARASRRLARALLIQVGVRFAPTLFGLAVAAVLFLALPGSSLAQTHGDALRQPADEAKTADEVTKLRAQLARVNAEIAELKRATRSVRADYRLRDKMADAEALAQQLGRAEAHLRALGGPAASQPRTGTAPPLPAASPHDGSVELEAKADFFSDRASKLVEQADQLTLAADRMRARKLLRQRAGAWDRDPFGGLESSKRNLAASPALAGSKPTGSGAGGPASPAAGGATTFGPASPAPLSISAPQGAGSAASPATVVTGVTSEPSRGSSPGSGSTGAVESSTSKSPPLATALPTDHLSNQRLYLDPTMAAEVRDALSAALVNSDPNALTRAAAILARAPTSSPSRPQASALRAKLPDLPHEPGPWARRRGQSAAHRLDPRAPVAPPRGSIRLISPPMRAGPCALLLCLGGVARASHADPVRYDLRVENGVEYDSNPARAEQISGPASLTGGARLAAHAGGDVGRSGGASRP